MAAWFYHGDGLKLANKVYNQLNLKKSQVKGYLNAEKNNLTAKLKSVERPTDILIKHKELLSNASKDRLILDNLENEFSSLPDDQLKSKTQDFRERLSTNDPVKLQFRSNKVV